MSLRFLDAYESLGVLGTGSMAQVHAARPVGDPATTVVVKVMRADRSAGLRARELFEREARYAARIVHPYIVRVVDAGVDSEAGPCVVMEFVPGSTLRQVLKKDGRIGVHRAGWLAGCLCHALEAAHVGGVIHRDLKPANLMVVNAGTTQEHLKVMDFGLSHLAGKPDLSRDRLAGAGPVVAHGTPAYIAPEQIRGDDVDGRADLYSAGVVLYEMLTGRLPFPDTAVDAVVDAHLNQTPPRFKEAGALDVSKLVEAVVQRCLAKWPKDRPASARVLATELGRALDVDLWAQTTPIGEARLVQGVPFADDVRSDPPGGPNTLVRTAEAWMPDRVAVLKLGGFLQDQGAELADTRPGLIRAVFARRSGGFLGRLLGPSRSEDIEMDLNLDRPNPADSRLMVTAVFRVPGGGPPADPAEWTRRCLAIFEEMRHYLMASG